VLTVWLGTERQPNSNNDQHNHDYDDNFLHGLTEVWLFTGGMTKLQPSQPYSEANKEFYAEWEKFFADGLFADGRRITLLDQDQGHCKVRDIATVRRDRTIAHCELFPELLVQ
jgi:hypothetical protein